MNQSTANWKKNLGKCCLGGTLLAFLSMSAVGQPTLSSNLKSPQFVAKRIDWTVNANSTDIADVRLSVGRAGEPQRIVYDFSGALRTFSWTPSETGNYLITATIRDQNGAISELTRSFDVSPRAFSSPRVSATSHPLVALYSTVSCPDGQRMRVSFTSSSPPKLFVTPFKDCDGQNSMNFYLGGLFANTEYAIRHELINAAGASVSKGPRKTYTTGSIPVTLPANTPDGPVSASTSRLEGVVLVSAIGATALPYATDLNGRVLWYLPEINSDKSPLLFRPVRGGTFLVVLNRNGLGQQVLREVDITGQVVRETNAPRINEQLAARGFADPFTAFHHEAVRLPNGHTAILGANERIVDGLIGPGPADIVGDYVVVLDENFQVVWAWSTFDHLNLTRGAILGEKCGNTSANNAGCPPILLVDGVNTLAHDWTHSNSVAYSPADGNLIVSMRHQDWVIKIAYEDGAGNGDVVWRLGEEGDFTFTGPVGSVTPWPYHQHDANYISDNHIVLYDNGNTRCVRYGQCFSRGMMFELDENAMTASHILNADLGVYAFAVGSAQPLSNGDFHFHSGTLSGFQSRIHEVLPDGLLGYGMGLGTYSYRSWRLIDLYSVPGDTIQLIPR